VRRTVHSVEQLRGRDGGDRHSLVAVRFQRHIQVQALPLGGDQHGGIDQRPHGARGIRPWRRTARRTSVA